jgi:AAA ATPase domain
MARINPFRPNSPVNPGMFVGRVTELDKLEADLIQARAGQPANFMLTGERGIGKTSLLDYLKHVAEGLIPIEQDKVKFLVIETDIDERTTQLALVKKIELGLRRELGQSEKARTFLSSTWKFLERVEAGGISLKEKRGTDNDLVVEEFAYSLADTVNRITDKAGEDLFSASYDGLLLLIDEADNSSSDLKLGSFLKLLTERLQRNDCDKMMIGLAGLPELREVLLKSHASSLRVFEELPLGRLSDDEVKRVINICLERANKDNSEQTTITDEAKDVLVTLSEGYPHFIQQFGYCAFAADTNLEIDRHDVSDGAFQKRGGLELIGDRYYRNDFYNKIQKDSYRQVLRIMATKADQWVTKAEIRAKFQGKVSTLDNAIQALRDRHIILPREGERGVYRLQHRGFALWIKLYASKPQLNGK